MQLVQNMVQSPINSTVNDPCRHELQVENLVTCPRVAVDSCQNTEIITSNVAATQTLNEICQEVSNMTLAQTLNEISRVPERTPTNVVLNIDAQIVENTNGLLTNEDLPCSTSIESVGKSNVQGTSPLNESETSDVAMQNQKNTILPNALPTADDTAPHLQNEIHLKAVDEKLISNEVATDMKSIATPLNEAVPVNDNTLVNQDTSSVPLVSGQVPTVGSSEKELDEISKSTVAADASHVAENGIIEQIPSTDNKRGKVSIP